MKRLIQKVIKPFLPKYEVICTNYQIIPGQPVNKNQSLHRFEKGAAQEALAFYSKVVSSDLTRSMAPIEVHLKKRGRVIQRAQYGAVDELKKIVKIAKK